MLFAVVLSGIGLLALSLTYTAAYFIKAGHFQLRVEIFRFLRLHVDIEKHQGGGDRQGE